MTRFLIPMCGAAIVCGSLVATTPARADDRSPEAILKEIDAVKVPTLDPAKRSDRAYVQQYVTELKAAMARKADLIGALYQADPDNPRLAMLLPARWQALSPMMAGPNAKDLTGELNEVIARA